MSTAPASNLSDTTLVAVISAAIHAALKTPHKVISIRQVNQGQSPESARMVWALEGRRNIFASHKLR